MDKASREPMLDIYLFETSSLIEQLEQAVLNSERADSLSSGVINEIFRIMHTIKSSSAMMLFNNISSLAHSVEDLFYYIREEKPSHIDNSAVTDIALESIDFIKVELKKIENGDEADGDASGLVEEIKSYLSTVKSDNPHAGKKEKKPEKDIKQKYYIPQAKNTNVSSKDCYTATVKFKEGCEMENIRAFTIIHNLKNIAEDISYIPEDIIDNDDSSEIIKREGFKILFRSDRTMEEMEGFFNETIFLEHLDLNKTVYEKGIDQFLSTDERVPEGTEIKGKENQTSRLQDIDIQSGSTHQNIISVNVTKLDKLMDLVGELVISEAMVTQNPDLNGMTLDNFEKSARQLGKITNELQDIVMSIRMVPLSATFLKMNRIVRDMSKKLGREVELKLIGEETEVDKNIIDHISDPLMHLIRNSIDHGIENADERVFMRKPRSGTVTLEAKSEGGDVIILVKDDGRGLDRENIIAHARKNGLTNKPDSELADKEVYSFIFLPGFSTNDSVTEYSGRGVGMDVVVKNIETVGGTVSVDSVPGQGTTVTLKIPLTLAIIEGMIIRVGSSKYTVPITSIRESFKAQKENVVKDPDGNEIILIRGQCYPILRLHELYDVKTQVIDILDGIMLMVESGGKSFCIFADELLGKQQVVVKALPQYIKKVRGLTGCTLLGDGGISLILDTAGLMQLI